MKKWTELLRLLSLLTQLGLSVIVPLLLCLFGALYLQNRFGLGGWIVAVGVLLGLGGAAASLRSVLRSLPQGKGPDDPPASLNQHS